MKILRPNWGVYESSFFHVTPFSHFLNCLRPHKSTFNVCHVSSLHLSLPTFLVSLFLAVSLSLSVCYSTVWTCASGQINCHTSGARSPEAQLWLCALSHIKSTDTELCNGLIGSGLELHIYIFYQKSFQIRPEISTVPGQMLIWNGWQMEIWGEVYI